MNSRKIFLYLIMCLLIIFLSKYLKVPNKSMTTSETETFPPREYLEILEEIRVQ